MIYNHVLQAKQFRGLLAHPASVCHKYNNIIKGCQHASHMCNDVKGAGITAVMAWVRVSNVYCAGGIPTVKA